MVFVRNGNYKHVTKSLIFNQKQIFFIKHITLVVEVAQLEESPKRKVKKTMSNKRKAVVTEIKRKFKLKVNIKIKFIFFHSIYKKRNFYF